MSNISYTSCDDLKIKNESLKKVRDDMSAKLAKHDDTSAQEYDSCLVVMEDLSKMENVHAQVASQLESTIKELDELKARPTLLGVFKKCPDLIVELDSKSLKIKELES